MQIIKGQLELAKGIARGVDCPEPAGFARFSYDNAFE